MSLHNALVVSSSSEAKDSGYSLLLNLFVQFPILGETFTRICLLNRIHQFLVLLFGHLVDHLLQSNKLAIDDAVHEEIGEVGIGDILQDVVLEEIWDLSISHRFQITEQHVFRIIVKSVLPDDAVFVVYDQLDLLLSYHV